MAQPCPLFPGEVKGIDTSTTFYTTEYVAKQNKLIVTIFMTHFLYV